jgi:hypothetical protein
MRRPSMQATLETWAEEVGMSAAAGLRRLRVLVAAVYRGCAQASRVQRSLHITDSIVSWRPPNRKAWQRPHSGPAQAYYSAAHLKSLAAVHSRPAQAYYSAPRRGSGVARRCALTTLSGRGQFCMATTDAGRR